MAFSKLNTSSTESALQSSSSSFDKSIEKTKTDSQLQGSNDIGAPKILYTETQFSEDSNNQTADLNESIIHGNLNNDDDIIPETQYSPSDSDDDTNIEFQNAKSESTTQPYSLGSTATIDYKVQSFFVRDKQKTTQSDSSVQDSDGDTEDFAFIPDGNCSLDDILPQSQAIITNAHRSMFDDSPPKMNESNQNAAQSNSYVHDFAFVADGNCSLDDILPQSQGEYNHNHKR